MSVVPWGTKLPPIENQGSGSLNLATKNSGYYTTYFSDPLSHFPYCSTPGNPYVKTNLSSSKIRRRVREGSRELGVCKPVAGAGVWGGYLHNTSLHDGVRILPSPVLLFSSGQFLK